MHGLLLVNKPESWTSHDLVKRVRRALKISAVGHAGTLDPMATGLMVLLLGEGTKLSEYILNGNKAYRLKVQLGLSTDTLDVTGQVISKSIVSLDPDLVVCEAKKLVGKFEWPVPIFSAAKVDGKKLYDYARKSEDPAHIPIKSMKFWGLQILQASSDSLEAEIHCSKGSFIRSWAAQLGKNLGVGGALSKLIRIESAPYKIDNALDITSIDNFEVVNTEAWLKAFIPIESAMDQWSAYTVKGKEERLLQNGQISYDLERRLIGEIKAATLEQRNIGIRLLSGDSGDLLAFIEALPNRGLKVRRVFKMS